MYEHFTDRARSVMQTANQVALYLQYDYITTEHLLLALIQEESSVAANVLNNIGVHWDNVLREVEKIVERGPYRYRREKLPLTPCVKSVIAHAVEEAELLDDRHVATEHLLLGLVSSKESVSSQVLINLGLTLEGIREETLRLLGREIPKEKLRKRKRVPQVPQMAMERIRSLERQLWNIRVVLGALSWRSRRRSVRRIRGSGAGPGHWRKHGSIRQTPPRRPARRRHGPAARHRTYSP